MNLIICCCFSVSDPCGTLSNLTCSYACKLSGNTTSCYCKSGYILDNDLQTCKGRRGQLCMLVSQFCNQKVALYEGWPLLKGTTLDAGISVHLTFGLIIWAVLYYHYNLFTSYMFLFFGLLINYLYQSGG
jgi:hypothetical protein